jgi:serpin B
MIVFLPRFKTTAEFSLNGALSSMGMSDAFDLKTADFSGMDGKRELFINAVIHKAFVEVNEEGTEAAAATAVPAGVASASPPPVTFRADHPFLFLIRDNKTGGILFIGRVSNPKAE